MGIGQSVNYKPSFVILWGSALSVGLFIGGLLTFALVLLMILVLLSHEHAHLKQCERHQIKVNSVTFTWLGGMIDADIPDGRKAIDVLSAGVINTGIYTVAFVAIWAYPYITKPIGLNFANNPYLNFLNSIALFSAVLFISNILPITYHSKTMGVISTDGWAAYKLWRVDDAVNHADIR